MRVLNPAKVRDFFSTDEYTVGFCDVNRTLAPNGALNREMIRSCLVDMWGNGDKKGAFVLAGRAVDVMVKKWMVGKGKIVYGDQADQVLGLMIQGQKMLEGKPTKYVDMHTEEILTESLYPGADSLFGLLRIPRNSYAGIISGGTEYTMASAVTERFGGDFTIAPRIARVTDRNGVERFGGYFEGNYQKVISNQWNHDNDWEGTAIEYMLVNPEEGGKPAERVIYIDDSKTMLHKRDRIEEELGVPVLTIGVNCNKHLAFDVTLENPTEAPALKQKFAPRRAA